MRILFIIISRTMLHGSSISLAPVWDWKRSKTLVSSFSKSVDQLFWEDRPRVSLKDFVLHKGHGRFGKTDALRSKDVVLTLDLWCLLIQLSIPDRFWSTVVSHDLCARHLYSESQYLTNDLCHWRPLHVRVTSSYCGHPVVSEIFCKCTCDSEWSPFLC